MCGSFADLEEPPSAGRTEDARTGRVRRGGGAMAGGVTARPLLARPCRSDAGRAFRDAGAPRPRAGERHQSTLRAGEVTARLGRYGTYQASEDVLAGASAASAGSRDSVAGCRRVELDALLRAPGCSGSFRSWAARVGSGFASVHVGDESPGSPAIGCHPGIPCKMRSAFLAGVMCP